MNKKIMKEALLATFLDVIVIITICILNEKHCNMILLLSNIIVGCSVKAAGFWNDLVADNRHSHLAKRFEISTLALGLFAVASLIMISMGDWFVLRAGVGLFLVFLYDLVAFCIFRFSFNAWKNKKVKA